MKNLILIIASLLPFLCFAQQEDLILPIGENISLNLPETVKFYFKDTESDTLVLGVGLGRASIYDQEISFNTTDKIADIKLEQQVEYCFSISDEGPHLDLRDWLVGYTPWLSVPRSGEQYQLLTMNNDIPKPPKPEFDMNAEEFLNAIKAEGFSGERWQEAARRSHSLNWLNSRFILKLQWTEEEIAQQKIIVFVLPLGC